MPELDCYTVGFLQRSCLMQLQISIAFFRAHPTPPARLPPFLLQAAAGVLAKVGHGMQLTPPEGLAQVLGRHAKKVCSTKRRRIKRVELMSMKEMAAALKTPSMPGSTRVSQ